LVSSKDNRPSTVPFDKIMTDLIHQLAATPVSSEPLASSSSEQIDPPTTANPTTATPAETPPTPSQATPPMNPPIPPPAPPERADKPSPPPLFAGDNANYDVKQFLFLLANYFVLANIVERSTKIHTAVGRLTGPALTWVMGIADDPVHQSTTFASFTKFTTALAAAFTPQEAALAARQRLWNCVQTTTVEAYVNLFRTICLAITHITDHEKLDRFLHGLKPAVRKELMVRGVYTFSDAASMALRYDLASMLATAPALPSALPPRPPARLNAINASTSSTPSTVRQPLTEAIKADLLAKGACFYCRQPGHSIADCPTRPARQGNGLPQ
jgi:hypothetical protein